jgi:hypothetical protein
MRPVMWVQGPHRRMHKLRVRPGNRGFAPPHLLYKLGGFGPGFRVRPGNRGFAPPHLLYKLGGLVRASSFRSGFRRPTMWALH